MTNDPDSDPDSGPAGETAGGAGPSRTDPSPAAVAAAGRLEAMIGAEPAAGAWLEVTQERVDAFADATSDHQFIHVDPERAATTRFGGTIAHGFLTLGLLVHLTTTMPGDVSGLPGLDMEVNYGLNKVRFMKPVPVGARIRATMAMQKVVLDGDTVHLVRRMSVEIEGDDRPAMVADWVSQAVFV